MKKISLFICLIIVLNVFSACGENNKDESKATSKRANSSKTSVSNVVSESSSKETTTSSVESETGSSSETTDNNVSESSDVLTTSSEEPQIFTDIKSPNQRRWLDLWDDPYETFIEWAKSNGTKRIDDRDYSQYDEVKPLVEFVSTQEKLLMPCNINKKFRIDNIKSGVNLARYFIDIGNGKSFDAADGFSLAFIPITNEKDKQKSLLALIKKYTTATNLSKSKKKCKYGTYYYDEDSAYFRYDDYLVGLTMKFSKSFDSNFFDYFDLEYASLEREKYPCFYSYFDSSFKEFMKTPYNSFSKEELENNEKLINWKKDKNKFLFVKESGEYKISYILAQTVKSDKKACGYSVYFKNNEAKTKDDGFNVTIRPIEGAELKKNDFDLYRGVSYSNFVFEKGEHKDLGAYYFDLYKNLFVIRYDDYLVIVTSKLGEISGRVKTEWLNCFELEYISKPNEISKNAS